MTSNNPQMERLVYETKPTKPEKKWGEHTAGSYCRPKVLAFRGPNGPINGADGKPFMVKVPYYRGAGVGRKKK